MKSLKDFDHIGRDKKTKIADKQQPREQNQMLEMDSYNYNCVAHRQRRCLAFGKTCSTCGKQNHFKVVCQSFRRWKWAWPAPQQPTCMPETHSEEEVPVPSWVESNKSFASVSTKSLIFHSIKSAIFTKLELSTLQKRTKITYKIDTGYDGNLMLFNIFWVLYPR